MIGIKALNMFARTIDGFMTKRFIFSISPHNVNGYNMYVVVNQCALWGEGWCAQVNSICSMDKDHRRCAHNFLARINIVLHVHVATFFSSFELRRLMDFANFRIVATNVSTWKV